MNFSIIIKKFIFYTLILLVILVFIFPFIWMLFCSLKPLVSLLEMPPDFYSSITLSNYQNVFYETDFFFRLFNSFLIAFFAVLVGLFLGLPASYALSRKKNKTVGTQVLYGTDDLSNNLNVTFDASPQWLTINPDEGTLMEGQSALISLIVNTNNLVDGDYNGYLRILSNGGNATLPVNLTVNGALLGDTNGDSVINVLDVIIMVNMILGLTEIDLNTADMNSDGVVNVLDITLLLNIILNG